MTRYSLGNPSDFSDEETWTFLISIMSITETLSHPWWFIKSQTLIVCHIPDSFNTPCFIPISFMSVSVILISTKLLLWILQERCAIISYIFYILLSDQPYQAIYEMLNICDGKNILEFWRGSLLAACFFSLFPIYRLKYVIF